LKVTFARIRGGTERRELSVWRGRTLALDEVTSHVDIANEHRVTLALAQLPLMRIIVAHRPRDDCRGAAGGALAAGAGAGGGARVKGAAHGRIDYSQCAGAVHGYSGSHRRGAK